MLRQTLWQDVGYRLHMLAKNLGFTAIVVQTRQSCGWHFSAVATLAPNGWSVSPLAARCESIR